MKTTKEKTNSKKRKRKRRNEGARAKRESFGPLALAALDATTPE